MNVDEGEVSEIEMRVGAGSLDALLSVNVEALPDAWCSHCPTCTP